MKNVLVTILQFVVFIAVFAAFSFLPPMHLEHVIGATPDGTRVFIWDGLLMTALLFLVILAVEAGRKRIRSSGVWTTVAFALAVVIGLLAKLGFKTNASF